MSYLVYKIMHLVSLFLLFMGMGISLGSAPDEVKLQKLGARLHGIALALLLVAGFGLLANIKPGGPIPGWVVGKIVLWVFLGALLVLIKRRLLQPVVLVSVAVALGGLGALFALYKPF